MKKTVKLGTMGDIFIGLTYHPDDVSSEGTIVLRSSNIQDGRLDFSDVVRVKCSIRDNLFVKQNDILMCSRNGSAKLVGKCALLPRMDEKMTFGAFMTIIRTEHNEYLLHFFNSNAFRNQLGSAATTTINQITRKMLDDICVPLYDNEKEHHITSKFNKIDALIHKKQQQLSKLDELVKSRFIELFGDPETNPKGWDRQRFDQICENLDSRRVPITSTERKAGNYPYYGASGIVDYVEDYIFDEDILLISEDGANLLMRSTPIAFSVSGKVWVNNHAHVVRFETKATQKYIEVCFALTDISGSITGTAQPKLNQAKLNAMLFCIPPIELQEQFAAFVEQTDKSKLAIHKSLEKLEILKKSLMQQYFG